MNRIASKLPKGRRPAHRHRPIWLLLALLTLGPAGVLAQTYTTIDCPDAVSTLASAINERGEIVGTCEDAGGPHGFLLRRGRFTLIDAPDAVVTVAWPRGKFEQAPEKATAMAEPVA